jgi:drug/metabolite transporter (DMT)-like permease
LQGLGLHPLWATVIVYLLSMAAILAVRPGALRQLVRTPALWVLLVASGTTNAAFNWAMVIGDVVRVVLLFYLMPLWAVLLARLLLHEALTAKASLRVTLALAGAAVVLWPAGGGWPLPATLADALGLIGGFSFALNNVMLRREAARPPEGRALAMFAGGVLVAGALAMALAWHGQLAWPPLPATPWVLGTLVLSVLFLLSNLALQHGAARLPANVTAVVMLSEVLVAAGSAQWLGGGALTLPLLIGGALILTATLLATR